MDILGILKGFWESSGLAVLTWREGVMILVSFVLLYLAIAKKFEPLLLLPIAFGILLANLPGAGLMDDPTGIIDPLSTTIREGAHWYDIGILRLIYAGVKSSIFPCLIFMGVGAMTDFGPLLANPMSLLLGAAAQLGIYVAFTIAILLGFTPQEAAAIGIIGGADGPTAIFLASKLAAHLLAPIAVAAYSYMALIPIIQPPIMKLLTTKKERSVEMKQLRTVSKTEKIIFPVVVLVICAFMLPSVAPLIGMFMLGNLFRESGVVERPFMGLIHLFFNMLCQVVNHIESSSLDGTSCCSHMTAAAKIAGNRAHVHLLVGTHADLKFPRLSLIQQNCHLNALCSTHLIDNAIEIGRHRLV